MSIPICISCNTEMKLDKTLQTRKQYKGRRYKCNIYNYVETVFGSQGIDSQLINETQNNDKPLELTDYQPEIE